MRETGQSSHRARSVVAVALLVLSTALAGCSLVGGQASGATTPPSGEAAEARAERLEGVQVTLNTTQRRDGTVSWAVQRISARPGTGQFRNEVQSTGPDRAEAAFPPGSLVVSNGSVRYIYPAGRDRVFRSEVDRRARDRSAELRRLFAALEDGTPDSIRRPTPGVSPLPVVPAGGGSAPDDDSVRWRESNVTVQYEGTATVAGRSTYVVDLRSTGDASPLVESTLWLDTEYLYPIKRHRVVERDGERSEFASVARNLTFDPEFAAGAFEFDPGDIGTDPTVVESGSYDSRAAVTADADVEVPVPDPDLPSGFRFERGHYSEGDRRHLSLTYTDGSDGSVRVSVVDGSANLTDGRRVSLDGRPAVFSRFRDRRYLSWNDGAWQYSVSGTVGNATLRGVAESVVAG
jgi:outer membrane lipoprotein-sorting protein